MKKEMVMRATKLLIVLVSGMALAACGEGYAPFDPGDIVHHKADNTPAVVLRCDRHSCDVSPSGQDHFSREWLVIGIAETPKRRPE